MVRAPFTGRDDRRCERSGSGGRDLVDANVLGEPTRPKPEARVVSWLRAHEQELCVDAVVLGELRVGVSSLSPGRKKGRPETWFEEIAATVECLP